MSVRAGIVPASCRTSTIKCGSHSMHSVAQSTWAYYRQDRSKSAELPVCRRTIGIVKRQSILWLNERIGVYASTKELERQPGTAGRNKDNCASLDLAYIRMPANPVQLLCNSFGDKIKSTLPNRCSFEACHRIWPSPEPERR
jgi:hypothetical protein